MTSTIPATAGLASALLCSALLVATGAAAAGETCQGLPATHVGRPDVELMFGTEGDDVIVTNGAANVAALGGADLICFTGETEEVEAGAGDDVVQVESSHAGTFVLGSGADTFTASPGTWAQVIAGTGDIPSIDSDRDVIAAFGGDITSGQRDVANPDQITMDDRGTVTWTGLPTPTSVIDGGGYSLLYVEAPEGATTDLDVAAGTMAPSGRPTLHFSGFFHFILTARPGAAAVEIAGSDGPEIVELLTSERLRHSASMGGGDDVLRVQAPSRVLAAGAYDGGKGTHDEIILSTGVDTIDLDMQRGDLTTRTGRTRRSRRASGFEQVDLMARQVHVRGTPGEDIIRIEACLAEANGLGGSDYLVAHRQEGRHHVRCPRRAVFFGGDGPDLLSGTAGADLLIGGGGRDKTTGRNGRDVCEAEVRTSCEVRR